MSLKNKGLLLILSTALISGFSVFINKFGVAMSDPTIFAFLKNTAVALIFGGLLIAGRNYKELNRLTKKQWGLLVLIGLVGGAIPFILFFKGLALTGAIQGAVIHKTMFIYVVVLAAIFLKEKINKNFLIGGLLLLAGNLALLKNWNFYFGYGDALILVATLFWAAENILSKYILANMESQIVAWGRMSFGAMFILGFLAISGQTSQIFILNTTQIGWIAITALFLFAYNLTWYAGLKTIPVSAATAILLLGSPITTALTALSTGKITIQDGLSGLLILAGLITIFGINIYKSTDAKSLITNH